MKTIINTKTGLNAVSCMLNLKNLALALIVCVSLLSNNSVIGQNATNYTFSTNASGSLTSMTGSTQIIAASTDDGNNTNSVYLIPFEFWFMGGWYNTFSASSNGVIRLSNTTAISTVLRPANFPAASQALIAPYLGDLETSATGKVHYIISGTAPNRAVVIEWLNMGIDYGSSTADGTFQLHLYEGTNNIEFVYGAMSVASTTGNTSVKIGFANNSTANNSITVNQSTYAIDYNAGGVAGGGINNTNTTGAISGLNSSADGSRRVFSFTPNYTFHYLTSGTSWTAPCGVTSVTAEVWGGGQGGKTVSSTSSGASGAGGSYSKSSVAVTASTLYSYQVGTAGAAGTSPTAGGDSWFSSTSTVLAKGGGSSSTNVGTTTFTGGTGAVGSSASSSSRNGASGGSSAGFAANGVNGTAGGNNTGGKNTNLGVDGSGWGGKGGYTTASGSGGFPGGGGGGGSNSAGANTSGSAGGDGLVVLWYPKLTPSVAPTTASASVTVGCSGYSTTLTQTGGTIGSGGTWYWYSGACGGAGSTLVGTSTSANASLSVNVTSNTTYYVRSEGACVGGTTACASVAVTVTPIPACISSATPTGTGQSASGVTLSWSSVSDATSYDVYFGTNGGGTTTPTNIVNGSNQVGTTYNTGALTGSTTYYFQIVPKNSCGSASSCTIYSFTTSAACTAPTFSATPTSPLCSGGSNGSISVSASGGTTPYQYSRDNGATWQSSSSFTGLSAGSYLIVVKGNDECTAAASSTTVTNPTALTASVTSSTLSGCSGSTVSMGGSASGGTGTLTYSWSPTTGLSSSSAASPTLTISGSQTYTLSVTDQNGCSSNQPTVAVSIGGITKYWAGAGSGMTGATTGTDFNTAANWSSTTVTKTAVSTAPQSCDNVVITLASAATITLSADATVNSVDFTTKYNNIGAILNVGSFKLETIANYSINMTTGAGGSSEIQQYIGNGGSLVVRGNANIGTGPVTSGYVMLRGYQSGALANVTGTITFYGNVSVGDGYATSSPQTSNVSKVIFDGSGTQNVSTGATYGFDFQTNYIQIGSANTPTVSFNGPNSWGIYGATPTLEVNNNAILNTNSYLIIKDGYCSNLTCSNYIWGAGGTIVLDPGSQFRLSGATGGQTGSNFPINFTTYTFAPTSTVEYYGGNQTVYATPTYGNLTISTTGTKTAGAGLNLDGTVTINTPATFAASTFTHNVAGSWVNNGTFTQGTSTVIFDGTSDAVVSGTNTFNNLTISKGASTQVVTLQNNTAVNATLNMSMGDLALGSNTLTVGSSSSSTGSITNGSANSFIIAYDNGSGSIGRVKRFVASTASTSYVFPIGGIDQAGTAFVYTPLTYTHVSGTAASTANIQVYTKATKIPQLNAGITNFLKRYWDVEPSGITSPNYNITYTYQTADVQGDQGQFAPIKYSSPDWYRPTNTDFTTGTPQGQASSVSANTLTWSGLTSFSQFSAAGNQASALPVELVSFQANCLESNTVDVTWSTASEHNSNYFRVDKSRNGTEWDVLGTIGAAENSQTLIDYSLTDYSPNPGINYYRLFQYDMDGTFTTYDIQAAVCKEQAAGTTLSTHPNPSARDFNVDLLTDEMEGNGTLVMTDAKGSVVYKMEVNVVNGNNNFLIQNFEGQPGMYYITVKVADKAVTTKHSIR